jgi:hypothetical protein
MPTRIPGTDVHLFVMLLNVMSVEDVVRWLSRPHPDLDGASPDDAMAQGDYEKVTALVQAVVSDAERACDMPSQSTAIGKRLLDPI